MREPRTPYEWLAERAIASLLAYDARAGHGAHSWAGAVEAFHGILRSCPYCGHVDPRLASKYRDGGRWVYHYGCPVGGPAWKNPDFPWETPEQIEAAKAKLREIGKAEAGGLPSSSPSGGFGLVIPYDEANTRRYRGRRYCRACLVEKRDSYNERRRERRLAGRGN